MTDPELDVEPVPNTDTLPTTADPNGPCPRCGRHSNFRDEGSIALRHEGVTQKLAPVAVEWVSALNCMGCRRSTVVIEVRDGRTRRAVHWWPVPGAGDLDEAVPTSVSSAYDEGMRCLAAGAPRASVVMMRAALAEFVHDRGSDAAQAAPNLFRQLEIMQSEGTLDAALVDWAREIREVGNAGAHPATLTAVVTDDAADLAALTRHLIKSVYEVPAQLSRSREARKTARRAATPPPEASARAPKVL